MLTKYTAAEIRARIAALGRLLHAAQGVENMNPATVEAVIRDAQDALQTYHDFLIIRERIPDSTMQNANLIGSLLFGEYVDTDDAEREYKRRANSVYGKTYDIDKEGSTK